MQKRSHCAATLFPLLSTLISGAAGQTMTPDPPDPDLGSLLQMKVSSVSRKEKSLSQAAGAIFVITQEDIERSGLSSIAEILRMVPGMDVARLDASKWAITSRGFNERFADKMLVMIDGRSVLTPLSQGVYWDVQDTVLEDIERIEVVRGPGAALWGANAVNGVINIITKKAKDTQGVLVTATTGGEEHASTSVRYGGEMGRSGFYRVYAKDENVAAITEASGQPGADSFKMMRGGFHAEWNASSRDAFTVQGDFYHGDAGQTTNGLTSLAPLVLGDFNNRSALAGGNVLARWEHASSDRFDTSVQVYADAESRKQPGVLADKRRTVDFELLQHFSVGRRHELTWGGDYRHDADDTVGSLNISFHPANRGTNLVGVFLQDEIMLLPEKVWLTVGSKLEHNSYSGFALQPNARVLWAVSRTQSWWAAVSQAAENSSRYDSDIRANNDAFIGPGGVTTLVESFGTHSLPPEKVRAYELGYRAQFKKRFTADIATFYNQYSDRHTQEPGVAFLEGDLLSQHLVIPTITRSNIKGETHGLEISATAEIAKRWKLVTGYTLFETHIRQSAESLDFDTARGSEGSSPRHEYQIRSMFDISSKLQFDTAMYYVGGLPGPAIPQYLRVDARFGWRLTKDVDLSFGAQNLLTPRHYEFGSGDLVNATPVGRNLYSRLTLRY